MALVARNVLADCEIAHQLLRKESMGSATWRPHWVLCLALPRARSSGIALRTATLIFNPSVTCLGVVLRPPMFCSM